MIAASALGAGRAVALAGFVLGPVAGGSLFAASAGPSRLPPFLRQGRLFKAKLLDREARRS